MNLQYLCLQKKFNIFILLLSILTISQTVDLGTRNIYERQTYCDWRYCYKEGTGYCDSFTSLKTDYFGGGNKQYLIVSCTYGKGVFIYDLQNMNEVKVWRNRSMVGIPQNRVQHSSSIEIYKSLLITLEDWDGIEALDYKSSSEDAAIAKFQCSHSHCSGDRTVHRQMIQVIDPETQEGGKFLYAYRNGAIRFTRINDNNGSYSWSEIRDPLLIDCGQYCVKGVSQLEGTTLVIISTTQGFHIYDAGHDHLPKVSTTTNASNSELNCQFATQIKGSRMIVTYDQGVLKVFEISPPDVFPIKIDYVKKHSTNRNGNIQEINSFGGRQIGLITNNYAEIWDIGVIDNSNVNTSFQMSKIRDYTVDDFGNLDYSGAIFRVPDTNYIVYNNNNFDILIDYACHHSCGDCNVHGVYGECTSCANSQNFQTASDGLKMEKNRLLVDNQCECVDNNNPCTYVDIGSKFCYHETAFTDSPTKCCGTNSCINDINSDICIERSERCPVLEQLAVFFDPLSGYWYPTPANPEYNCHYTCYVCLATTDDMCRSCDEENTNRVLQNSPGRCVCKDGYYEKNAGDKICTFIPPCSSKCITCNYGTCTQCIGSQAYKNNDCDCVDGYKDDGNNGCIKDCRDDETNRELSGGNCVCQTGYQETNPVSDNCEEIPCVNKCVSCSLGICSQCEGLQANKDSQTCLCLPGYKFEGINCVKDCQDNITNRELFNGDCVCQQGYYELNIGDANCIELPCVDKCDTCSLGECSLCAGGNDNKDDQTCECDSGFFELDTGVCEVDCDTDNTHKKWDYGTSQCDCIQGYNDDAVAGTCEEDECGPKCLTCSAGNCSACFGSAANRNPPGSDQTVSCLCIDDYEDHNNVCRKACDTANTNRVNLDVDTCECDDGYQELSPVGAACEEIPCNDKCNTCSKGVCQLCKKPINRDTTTCDCVTGYIENAEGYCELDCETSTTNKELNGNGNCVCLQGYHLANPNDLNCTEIPCVDLCATCSLGVCQACQDNQDNKDPQTCECLSGYHLVGNQCLWNCQTDLTYKELVDPSGTDCQCVQGYFALSSDQFICQEIPCSQKCATCVLGECQECQGDQVNKDDQSCECLDGFSEIGGKCYLECNPETTNRAINFLTETCECKKGYYEETDGDAICTELPCTDSCVSCSKGICLECEGEPLYRDPQSCECQDRTVGVEQVVDGETLQVCIPIKKGKNRDPEQPFGCLVGFYEQPNSYDCLPCSPLCKTCESRNECSECTFSFFNKPPTCQVFSMFNEVPIEEQNLQDELESCETQTGCTNCDIESGKCLTCDETLNRILNKFSNQCECKPGYKEYRNREACQRCYYYSGECLITCPKNSKLDRSTGHCIDIVYQSQDNVMYMAILVSGVLGTLFLTVCGISKMPLKVKVKEVHMEILNNKEEEEYSQGSENNNSEQNE